MGNIDPDVQLELDATNADVTDLENRVKTLEDTSPDVAAGDWSYDFKFSATGTGGPKVSRFDAKAVNEATDWLYKTFRGGRIIIDGEYQDLMQSTPIVTRPGVEVCGVGVNSVTEKVRTLLVPTFSNGAQLVQTPLTHAGAFRSWGASSIHHLTVRNKLKKPGLRVLDVEGGNHSRVHDISAQGNDYEYGINFVDLRGKADGQYSYYDHIQIYGATYPLHVDRSCPDVKLSASMFYGKNKGSSTGPEPGSEIYIGSEAWELTNVTSQFTDIGWHLNAVHTQIIGGAQEMYVGWSNKTKATAVFKLGPKARDIVVVAHSLANLNSAEQFLDADPAASYIAFRDLPQLRPTHIPTEYHKWFTFIEA